MCIRFLAVLPSGTRSKPIAGPSRPGRRSRRRPGRRTRARRRSRGPAPRTPPARAGRPRRSPGSSASPCPHRRGDSGRNASVDARGPVMVQRMRRRATAVLATAIMLSRSAGSAPRRASDTVRVGTLDAPAVPRRRRRPLRLDPPRPWEPGNPAAGHGEGRVRVPSGDRTTRARRSARWCRTRAAPATAPPAPPSSYAAMYGPLLDRRNLLLVDQRGTGRSEPVDCPGAPGPQAGLRRRGRALRRPASARAPTTTRPPCSADDLAARHRGARLGKGRRVRRLLRHLLHPGLRRPASRPGPQRRPRRVLPDVRRERVVPHPGPGDAPGLRRRVPSGPPACRGAGPAVPADAAAGAGAGAPAARGAASPTTPTGAAMQVPVDGRARWPRSRSARPTRPAFYRELTAALRSGLAGDHAPLLRLVAEATGGGTDAGPVAAYSEGLDAAVACHDYPQLYDMTAAARPRARSSTPPR